MTALNYLEIYLGEIEEDFVQANKKMDYEQVVDEIKKLLDDLLPIRNNKNKTIERCKVLTSKLKEQIKSPLTEQDIIKLSQPQEELSIKDFLLLKWCIAVLKIDDTYTYSYNELVQFFNRSSNLLPLDIKIGVDVIVALKQEEMQVPAPKQKTNVKMFEPTSLSFYFIEGNNWDGVLPLLQEQYKNAKPIDIALMTLALVEMKIINQSILNNQTTLHRILSQEFEGVGSRSSLQTNITKYRFSTYFEDLKRIQNHAAIIKDIWQKTGKKLAAKNSQ